MSVKNEKFVLFKEFIEKMDTNVKLFYISQHFYTEQHFGLFISCDDRAYGVGENGWGQLGLGHNQNVAEFIEIPELSGKKICEFFEGNGCMFARSENHEIYCWGGNNWGQLGIGSTSQMNVCLKPTKNQFFRTSFEPSIRKISCGDHHNLGLSTDGRVYGWGKNCYSQMGCGKTMKIISKPLLIEFDCDDQDQGVYSRRNQCNPTYMIAEGSFNFSKLESLDQVVSQQTAESSFSKYRATSLSTRSLSTLSSPRVHEPNKSNYNQSLSQWNISDKLASLSSPSSSSELYAQEWAELSPYKWTFHEFENKIKEINVFSNSCFAINEKNQVYFWGEDIWGVLVEPDEIVEKPKLIKNRIASQVYCNNEEIFFCHDNKITHWKDSNEKTFTYSEINEFSMENDKFIFQDSQNVFEFIDNEFKKTKYTNILDYYLNEYQSTFKTIQNKN